MTLAILFILMNLLSLAVGYWLGFKEGYARCGAFYQHHLARVLRLEQWRQLVSSMEKELLRGFR